MSVLQQVESQPISKDQWIERFVLRMESLDIPMASRATRLVEAAWRDAGDIAPEEVAEVYAAEDDAVKPPREAARRSAPTAHTSLNAQRGVIAKPDVQESV